MVWHSMSAEEAAKALDVSINDGLSAKEALSRQKKYGKNSIDEKKTKSLIYRFAQQLCDYMVVILIIAAAVSFAMSLIEGSANWVDPVIILFIVILNATIGVVQESKAEKALEALKKMSSPTAKVKRNGKITALPVEDIVPGDIVFMETGSYVPADIRLITSVGFKTDESALTGESLSVEKDADKILKKDIAVADAKNMAWSTTIVNSGRGCGIVVETGMNTQVGSIAKIIISEDDSQTPLQQKLAQTSKILGSGALIICAVIFVMGVMRHIRVFDMFMTSVSLAVAAIPEGLPAIVTIMLALGVQKMAKSNAIIRRLPAVETLGSATVICSDKTGTLTQNKMTVTDIEGDKDFVLELAMLCSNNADVTENAIINAGEKAKLNKNQLDKKFRRIKEIPFDSSRKIMTTVHKIPGGFRIVAKGAPDVLVKKCNMSVSERKKILDRNIQMAQNALRVIAVAYLDTEFLPENLESNLKMAGLIGMIDPPRPEVKSAVNTCTNAGIKVVMITGDHIETATAIAKDVGIFKNGDTAMTGEQLNKLSDKELKQIINKCTVFARVTPEHKVRIVKTFREKGETVAMTGDGVNDAPALKAADIGCAMGISGTDVARGAADMILTDDNFATIVSAVKEGRGIYSNIRKAIHFLLSSNMGEIVTIFVAMLFGWQAPLIAIQLLWVNLVTDSLPAIALGVEKPEADIMDERPIDRKRGLFEKGIWFGICIEGFMIGMLALLAFSIGKNVFDSLTLGRTMSFTVLSISQIIHSFNMRSKQPLYKIGIFGNKYLTLSALVCIGLQVAVVCIPSLASLFGVVSLTFKQWGMVITLSLVPLAVMEMQKSVNLFGNKTKNEKYNKAKIIKIH